MRNIPENNLAYPVLIQCGNSAGSGFLLKIEDNLYLVTAKHVILNLVNNTPLGTTIEVIAQPPELSDNTVTKFSINISEVNILKHDNLDITAIHIAKIIPDNSNLVFSQGVYSTLLSKTGVVNVTQDSTKNINEVLVGNDIYLYGYPVSLGLKEGPGFNLYKPLLRKGIVAGIFPQDKSIILDCPAYGGNSGGPVVEVETVGPNQFHKVIGIVVRFIPHVVTWKNMDNSLVNTDYANSGYSIAISIEVVIEMIKENLSKS